MQEAPASSTAPNPSGDGNRDGNEAGVITVPPGARAPVPPAGPPSRPPVPLAPPPTGRRANRRGRRVVQGRRSRRVVRRIDSWTVLKLSFVFYICVALVVLVAGVALWNIAAALNVIGNIEKFIRQLFDLQTFRLRSGVILAWSGVGAGVLVLLGTGINVLVAVLYNLISDVVGGVQVIVLEEQDTRPPSA